MQVMHRCHQVHWILPRIFVHLTMNCDDWIVLRVKRKDSNRLIDGHSQSQLSQQRSRRSLLNHVSDTLL